MKKGKVILSVAALVCTVVGAFAMKGAKKITGHATCYTGTACTRHAGCHTVGTGAHNSSCGLTGTIFTTSKCGTAHETSYCTTAN